MAQIWARTMRQIAFGPKYDRFLCVPLTLSSIPSLSSSFSSSSSSTLPRLTLFTHDACSLCDEALEAIAHLNSRFVLETVDILHPDNKSWKREYRYDIPVFHLEGEFLMKHRADVELLERKLVEFEAAAAGNDKVDNI